MSTLLATADSVFDLLHMKYFSVPSLAFKSVRPVSGLTKGDYQQNTLDFRFKHAFNFMFSLFIALDL